MTFCDKKMMHKVNRVVLVNLLAGPKVIHSAREALNIEVVRQAVRHTAPGVRVEVYPEKTRAFSADKDSREIAKLVRRGEDAAIGISLGTEAYRSIAQLVPRLRAALPGVPIILGGPHLRFEFNLAGLTDTKGINAVRDALSRGWGDMAIVGGCVPFAEWVGSGLSIADFTAPGAYKYVGGELVGEGVGAAPALTGVPYIIAGRTATILLDNRCGNLCDTCVIDGSTLPVFTHTQKKAALLEIYAQREVKQIDFDDANPLFPPQRFLAFKRLIEEVEAETRRILPKTVCLDPAALTGEWRGLFDPFLIEHQFVGYFLGRETSSLASFRRMGIRTLGRIKTEDECLQEGRGIRDFIDFLRSNHRKGARPYSVQISYILDPFAGADETLAQIAEMHTFERLTDDKVRVTTQFSTLTPFPGNALRPRVLAHLRDPDDFSALRSGENMWRPDAGPTARVIDAVLDVQGQRGDIFSEAFPGNGASYGAVVYEYFTIMKGQARRAFAEN